MIDRSTIPGALEVEAERTLPGGVTVPEIIFNEAKHTYTVNGVLVPSVTQILGVLQKGALPWWGMTIGVQGVARLHSRGVDLPWDDPAAITGLLTRHKLTVNHVRDRAGDRGTGVHTALERWLREGKAPNPSDFAAEERGYVQALARAILALNPKPVDIETMIASVTHGFAGRYDARVVIDGKTVLLDLKTSKAIYPEQHFPQLAAYEGASVELGFDPTDEQIVLRLGSDGEFEVATSNATFDDFLGIKAAYDALQRIKGKRIPVVPARLEEAA